MEFKKVKKERDAFKTILEEVLKKAIEIKETFPIEAE